MVILNNYAARRPYPAELRAIMNRDVAAESRRWLATWNMLGDGPTPLWDLSAAAHRLGIARLWVKDEAARSPLGSFKALGAPIALVRLIMRLWPDHQLAPSALLEGRYRELVADLTVVSATDGNHGRALAAAAQSVGCRCVIVLHGQVGPEREAAIAAYGARIVRIAGDYDASVAEAARLAAAGGWQVVSDTSYPGYEEVPRDVMQGYATIAAEAVEQAAAEQMQRAFTHVILQGGVGGLAAGIASYLWELGGANRPRLVVVEPEQADCLLQSALAGRPARASGAVDSVMAGLACGEASPLAWRFLQPAVDAFVAIRDADAVAAMQALARGRGDDVPVVAGESGAAGLAGLVVLRTDGAAAKALALGPNARVLVVNTEGATAPAVYRELVGEPADAVRERQAAWLRAREVRR